MFTTSKKYDSIENFYAKELIKTKQSPSKTRQKKIARSVFAGDSFVKTGCPKDWFLDICEEYLIIGISIGKYTDSKKNKAYGIYTINILRENDKYKTNKRNYRKRFMECQIHTIIKCISYVLYGASVLSTTPNSRDIVRICRIHEINLLDTFQVIFSFFLQYFDILSLKNL